jgi:hypothetical protein
MVSFIYIDIYFANIRIFIRLSGMDGAFSAVFNIFLTRFAANPEKKA